MDKITWEPLQDPLGDRVVKDLPLPPCKPLKDSEIFSGKFRSSADACSGDIPNYQLIKKYMLKEGHITKLQCIKLCNKTLEILKKEPNLKKVQEPVVIVGDVHGQYYDVCHMLEKAGSPKDINYLFLGDYVDRGINGIEVMILLMCLKINFPNQITMLRGNHESRAMTENFTFREEVINMYDEDTYETFMDVFDSIPLASIVDDKYLAMHGGISPELRKVEDINKVNRFQEIPLEGLFCDLLWSDPMKDEVASKG